MCKRFPLPSTMEQKKKNRRTKMADAHTPRWQRSERGIDTDDKMAEKEESV